MLRRGIARPPLPPHNRIPNFANAEKAAAKLAELPEWRAARIVKVNPDSPQFHVRLMALRQNKLLIMPTPRMREGFLVLDPSRIPKNLHTRAATIRGAFQLGRKIAPEEFRELKIDFIVEGSVAVNEFGERLGKGRGYGEFEFAVLLELGCIDIDVPIATTVHDVQVVPYRLPQEPYDVPVDYVVTPTRIVRARRGERPKGIIWELLDDEKRDILQKTRLSSLLRGGASHHCKNSGGGC